MSYADSYDSVRKAAIRGGRNVWVMSRDEAQAKEYIRYCKFWANIFKFAARDFGEQLFAGRDGQAIQAQRLSFSSGASIYALSSNPALADNREIVDRLTRRIDSLDPDTETGFVVSTSDTARAQELAAALNANVWSRHLAWREAEAVALLRAPANRLPPNSSVLV